MQAGGRWGGREEWDEEINEREVSETSQARDCGRRSDVRAGQTTRRWACSMLEHCD